MRSWFRAAMTLTAAAAVLTLLALASRPVSGQAPSAGSPRTADGRPNLNGIWQAFNAANWDIQSHGARPALAVRPGRVLGSDVPAAPVLAFGAVGGVPGGLGVVDGDEIPYRPAAAARKSENAANWLTRDPEIKCFLPGVPRATYMPYPFQIVQAANTVKIVYEFAGATRTIHMDKAPAAPVDTWMGHSVGRWEGETLVVDVTALNDQTWFDRAGNFHSDALHVVERYTPAGPYHLNYEATIEDPKVFTKPWKMRMPLYRRVEPNAQLVEYRCVEFVEELMYGHLRREPFPIVKEFEKWYLDSRAR